jgi:hypothetical protein
MTTTEFIQAFSHNPVYSGDRLMIESVCTQCGASKLVSMLDGSLKKWEKGHKCCENPQSPGDAIRDKVHIL